MSLIEEVYASVGPHVILQTIELTCDAWDEPIYLVDDQRDWELTTENSETVTFLQCAMTVSLPKRDATAAQDLAFAIDGVRDKATSLLRDAMREPYPVRLVHRVYLDSDTSQPAEPPLQMAVKMYKAQASHVEITAGIFDMIDMRWPRDVYDSETAPQLIYMQD